MMMRVALVLVIVVGACGRPRSVPYVPPPQPHVVSSERTGGPIVPASELKGVVKRIHIGVGDEGLRMRIASELQPLMGVALDAPVLRAALVRVMKVRGVADVVARGEQLVDGVGLVLDVVQEPVLRNISAVEAGGKRIPLGVLGVGLGIGSLLDPLKVQAAAEAVRARYVEKGHLEATARWRRVPAHDGIDVVIEVDPGVPSTIASITFTGNTAISSGALAAELRGWLVAGAPVVTEVIDRAVLVLTAHYWDNGHANVRIATPKVGTGRVALEFVIDEGPIFRFGSISAKGDIDPNEHAIILATFGVNPGDLFSRSAVADGRARVEAALGSRSTKYDAVPLTKVDLAARTIDLTLEITRK